MLKTSTFVWELEKRHGSTHDWIPKHDPETHRRSGREAQASHFTCSKLIQHQNQQSSDGSNDCEDVDSVQELARWTLLSLEAHGGCTNAKVHMTWKHDGALIWLGQIVAGSARPWQDLSP